jgi:hypothetical protein
LQKEEFFQYVHLFDKHPWLQSHEASIIELMNDCQGKDEQTLVLSLLERFTYIKEVQWNQFFNSLATKIIQEWNINQDNTQIIGTTFDGEPDSAHIMIHPLRTLLARLGWHKQKPGVFSVSIPAAVKMLNTVDNTHSLNVIIVDEFVGTGATLVNDINWFRNDAALNHRINDIIFRVCVVAAMKEAKDRFANLGIEMYASKILTKGISEYYQGDEMQKALANMLRLESGLEAQVNGKPLPSLGHGAAEALFARYDSLNKVANTPNSVFPVFWWPYLQGHKKRNSILTRAVI